MKLMKRDYKRNEIWGVWLRRYEYIISYIYSIYLFIKSIHAEKTIPNSEAEAHTHLHTWSVHTFTKKQTFTQPLSHYFISTSCICAHTFTFNYMDSDALMQVGTHKYPGACIQVFCV